MTEEEYFEKAKWIWKTYVPKSGQAEFVQGELLRAVEKLRDEAQRNGNGNFNAKCHGILVSFLRLKLSDPKVFDQTMIKTIGLDLDKLNIEDRPYLEDDVFDRLNNRIVDWHMVHKEPIPHEKNPELYC